MILLHCLVVKTLPTKIESTLFFLKRFDLRGWYKNQVRGGGGREREREIERKREKYGREGEKERETR